MFCCSKVARRLLFSVRSTPLLFNSVRSYASHSGLTPRSKREFISSEAVNKDQLTPALQQYFRFKEQYKGKSMVVGLVVDYVLFFRLGDFYEFFFEDAIMISQILGIALTTRGKYQSLNS